MASRSGSRASNKGFLSFGFTKYLELLEWTGQQVSSGKPGSIPKSLGSIFERLQLNGETWVDCIKNFKKWFGNALGRPENMAKHKKQMNQQRLRGNPKSLKIFAAAKH